MADKVTTVIKRNDDPPSSSSSDNSHNQHHALWFWYEPGTCKEEKWLLLKLDFFILLYTCLTFFIKYIDQGNINYAYHSGMQKDLKLYGNELNWMTTYFNVGIIVGAPFSAVALTIIQPRYWLPFCTTAWSLFVLFHYKVENVQALYVLRFFTGLFESGAMPGAFYIIGSWYRKSEISRRMSIFMISATIGVMIGGYIQGGLYQNMNGTLGLAAWRWLFIFNFIIAIPVVIFGFFCCPDEPKSPKKIWWMTTRERDSCIKRLMDEGRDAEPTEWTFATVKNIASSWQFWGFCVAWGAMEVSCAVQLTRWMQFFLELKDEHGKAHYGAPQTSYIPTSVNAVQLLWIFFGSVIADHLQRKWIVIVALCCIQQVAFISFAIWPDNYAYLFSMYYVGIAYGGISPILTSWLSLACGKQKQLRAVTTAVMVSIGYRFIWLLFLTYISSTGTPAQQFLFPTADSPKFRHSHGYIYAVAFITAFMVICGVLLPLAEKFFGYCESDNRERNDPEGAPALSGDILRVGSARAGK